MRATWGSVFYVPSPTETDPKRPPSSDHGNAMQKSSFQKRTQSREELNFFDPFDISCLSFEGILFSKAFLGFGFGD